MKTEDVNTLINLLNDNELTELTYEDESFKLTLKKEKTVVGVAPGMVMESSTEVPTAATNVIKAPLVGVFYDKPTPDSQTFKQVGDSIKKR